MNDVKLKVTFEMLLNGKTCDTCILYISKSLYYSWSDSKVLEGVKRVLAGDKSYKITENQIIQEVGEMEDFEILELIKKTVDNQLKLLSKQRIYVIIRDIYILNKI